MRKIWRSLFPRYGDLTGRQNCCPFFGLSLASDVASDDIEGAVLEVLSETGVMRGEFGAAQTYKTKADLLRPWLDDANKRVAAFADREIRSLERVAASESRRAREKIAMRKLRMAIHSRLMMPDRWIVLASTTGQHNAYSRILFGCHIPYMIFLFKYACCIYVL